MPLWHQAEELQLPEGPAERIVSLVPSQTELLHALGLEEQVIAITKFCVRPTIWHREKPRIGGTKKVDIGEILAMRPDLVIANKEENDQEQIQELAKHVRVWVCDVRDLASSMQMIGQVGQLTGRTDRARSLVGQVSKAFHMLKPADPPIPVMYLIWNDPLMAAGADTFINDMLERCGMQNLAAGLSGRYPELDANALGALRPAVILLSSEPFPFRDHHVDQFRAKYPRSAVERVDGEVFSWYGVRSLGAPAYFQKFLDRIKSQR